MNMDQSSDNEKWAYNPFCIDLILENLFPYLTEEELKSCRSVCRQWSHYATKNLQICGKTLIFGALYKINLFQIRPDMDTMKTFLRNVPAHNEQTQPFVKFELRPNVFASPNKALLLQFLQKYESSIESLRISLAFESEDSYAKQSLQFNLPNLTSLDFCNSIRGELRPSLKTDLNTSRVNLLEAFIDASPNLEKLSFWCDSENILWPGEVVDLIVTKQFEHLSSLKISFPVTDTHVLNLSMLQAKLTAISFVFREPQFSTKAFRRLLESQKDTLKSLKIIDLQCDRPKSIEFPVMSRLKDLEIEGTFYGENCVLCFNKFDLATTLPTLRKLTLTSCHQSNFDLESLLSSYRTCLNVEIVNVFLSHEFLNSTFIMRFGTLFPKLKKAVVSFPSESMYLLQDIFQHWTSLTELTVNLRKCGVNVDNVFCGYSSDEKAELSYAEYRSITNLKSLRKLQIKGEYKNYKEGKTAFTDKTAMNAFLKMNHLQYLIMWPSGLSQECLELLSRRLHYVQIPNDTGT